MGEVAQERSICQDLCKLWCGITTDNNHMKYYVIYVCSYIVPKTIVVSLLDLDSGSDIILLM